MNGPFYGQKAMLVDPDSCSIPQPIIPVSGKKGLVGPSPSPTFGSDRALDGSAITRKRSTECVDMPKRNRKKDDVDNRWSQRFTWPDELHRDFVAAIFDVGLKHSSPSSIMEHMPKNELVTTERIKSHLQKYRLHRMKSKQSFMDNYETSLKQFKSNGMDMDPKSLKSAEVAAHLSYTSIAISETDSEDVDREALLHGGVLQLPILTEDEKKSPIGASMGYMLGLFFSLKQQLYMSRGSEGLDYRPISSSTKHQINVETIGPNPLALKDSFFTSVTNHDMNGAFHSSLLTMNPLEETNNMKREMQHHINFQNNLRRMKEQEFTKCMTLIGDPSSHGPANKTHGLNQQKDGPTHNNIPQDGRNNNGEESMFVMKGESRDSIAAPEELWNTEGVDAAFLFEFLRDGD